VSSRIVGIGGQHAIEHVIRAIQLELLGQSHRQTDL
jgi:hypothetical protein